jgi:hypothetical protein
LHPPPLYVCLTKYIIVLLKSHLHHTSVNLTRKRKLRLDSIHLGIALPIQQTILRTIFVGTYFDTPKRIPASLTEGSAILAKLAIQSENLRQPRPVGLTRFTHITNATSDWLQSRKGPNYGIYNVPIKYKKYKNKGAWILYF